MQTRRLGGIRSTDGVGMRRLRGCFSRTGAVGVVIMTVAAWLPAAHAQHKCTPAVARLVSLEGKVEVLDAQGRRVDDVAPNADLCARYVVNVSERSRAALLLLSNETTLRLDQKSSLTLRGVENAGQETTWVMRLNRGALHVITRTRPRSFTVETPFINANVDGTEFTVTVTESEAAVALQEGRVCASNAGRSARIDGASATVALYDDEKCEVGEKSRVAAMAVSGRAGQPPIARGDIVVEPVDQVKWALYYPAVFDYASVQADLAALAQPGTTPERLNDPQLLTRYAGALLSVGRLDEAQRFIDRALRIDASNSNAHALLAIVAVVRNEKDKAIDEATKATEADPKSPAAWIALSYAQQAAFRIEDAVRTMEKARSTVAPSALFLARLAELYMSVGELEKARATAEDARARNPDLGKVQTVFGFANLISIQIAKAKKAFKEAIRLDQGDPLPRLGLGLARIREGDLSGGREELEIAAVLDPANSLIRSYLGKAYYEEKRDALASKQFELAKQRDPHDPTPWFYDAIVAYVDNRPVDALDNLTRSIEKNNNRAVYRSSLLLDDDRAARTTEVAAIYRELGFEKLAISESTKALADNFANDSAHRELAVAYANMPRHDIARVSEALQAQLRQPLTSSPIPPLISSDNLVILRQAGPTRLGTNEFNQLFSRDQLRLQFDGIGGTRGTFGDQLIASGLSGNVAYAASQLHYETDGFAENNSARKNAYDMFVQAEFSPRTSVQADVRRTEFDLDQTFFNFDPNLVFPARIKEKSDAARLGGRQVESSNADWIWMVLHEERTRSASILPDDSGFTQTDTRADTAELQRTAKYDFGQIVAGFAHIVEKNRLPIEERDIRTKATTAYVYASWAPRSVPIVVEAGISRDWFYLTNTIFGDKDVRYRWNPKLGIIWSPDPRVTIRGAFTSSIKRPFIGSQTLEPTEVAGFNQFFTGFDLLYGDRDGTLSRRAGFGIDTKIALDAFAGFEVTGRKLRVPNFNVGEMEWKERAANAYYYKTFRLSPASDYQLAASAEYEYERIMRPDDLTGPEGIVDVSTQRLPLGLAFFAGRSLMLRAAVSYVRQSGTFSADPSTGRFDVSDSAWITDVSLEYRLPKRYGILAVGARNLFDNSINVFETDPVNPRIAKRRLVFGRISLVF